ncbi:patatin-like protein 6 [Brachypodium distachyon]|uniref:patatin-like protein 6 n=1 Tax=Brachypodium distachyon TaxID=15368 RepID=UPI000D0DCE81|nr:patatin-like protein 6 [Brachypodium distachyon]|eukprot:XP_024311857.1 patatin-like protein 6 [Brachypodium distachyon]
MWPNLDHSPLSSPAPAAHTRQYGSTGGSAWTGESERPVAPQATKTTPTSTGHVRVLSIDRDADGGALVARVGAARVPPPGALWRPHVADYFDRAAGSGAGGFLAAALFTSCMPVEDVRDLMAKNQKLFSGCHCGSEGLFRARPEACYDVATAAPFVFSRDDAVEVDAFDFLLWKVCAGGVRRGPRREGVP